MADGWRAQNVGWMERSDTHLAESRKTLIPARFSLCAPYAYVFTNRQMGIAALHPSGGYGMSARQGSSAITRC